MKKNRFKTLILSVILLSISSISFAEDYDSNEQEINNSGYTNNSQDDNYSYPSNPPPSNGTRPPYAGSGKY